MKQILRLFQPQQLLFFTIVLTTLISCSDSNIKKKQKVDVEIVIVNGDITNHRLTLNPPGPVEADKGKKVTWIIGPNAINVSSFRIERKKTAGTDPIFWWLDGPPSDYVREGEGRVGWNVEDNTRYEYAIYWQDFTGSGEEHKHDPIISVRPSKFNLYQWLSVVILGLLGLASLYYLYKKIR